MSNDKLKLAYRFADALNTGAIDAFDEFVADSYINHNPLVEPGLAGVKQFFTDWLAAFPDTRVTVEDALAVGDTVVGRFTYQATHRGEFRGMAPAGRPITMRSIDIWRVVDGKFVEHWDELNTLELFQQSGLIPSHVAGGDAWPSS